MKRSPLKPRKKPLRRSKWLKPRPKGSLPLQTRLAVLDRARHRCERCKAPRPLQLHHRKLRSAGGDDEASNLAAVCAQCHDHIHRNPAESAREGWIIRRGAQ